MAIGSGVFVAGNGDVTVDPRLDDTFENVAAPPDYESEHWLGPEFWGNRLQDWKRTAGRLICLRGEAGYEVRSAALLTREIVEGDDWGHLRVKTGIAGTTTTDGFCGFLIGVGADLDYRAAALAQRRSGEGGGLLCTFDASGHVRFRDHTDSDHTLRFDTLEAEEYPVRSSSPAVGKDDQFELLLSLIPAGDGRFDLQLNVVDATNGERLAGAVCRDVPESVVCGHVLLVSSPAPHQTGTRWWFEEVQTAGEKIAQHPERTFGPIAGTLYSQSDGVLKLTAQLLPVATPTARVTLEYRPVATDQPWVTGPSAPIESGYVARFSVDDWDASRDWEYRVVYPATGETQGSYCGRIPAEPVGDELTIGLVSCLVTAARSLDTGTDPWDILNQRKIGRYTPANLYFPHTKLVQNLGAHKPDLLAFVGDQFYENNPTRVESRSDPGLDYLYKWYLWLWAFRDLTRRIPTITLVDDHDVYQGNVWGAGGFATNVDSADSGGYRGTAEFLRRVLRIQTSHNPEPADPIPTGGGIPVYYGAFEYGGVQFAIVEGRKFKSPKENAWWRRPELLGRRQERFLADWAQRTESDRPAICLTQTAFAAVNTTSEGKPRRDFDSNGYPQKGREQAIRLLRKANALVLSGDQHLASLLRHGIDTETDGVVQFNGPAGGTGFQRWFEPEGTLRNSRGQPNTGNFTDAFGNSLRVLAVANPSIPQRKYDRLDEGGRIINNRDLKNEGYGIVHVDHERDQFIIECWPWDEDPATSEASQFPGWPYTLPFDEAGRD